MYGQQLSRNVIAAGGAINSASGTSRLSTTIGQAFAGSGTIQLYETIHQGFWLPLDLPTSVRAEPLVPQADASGAFPNPFDDGTSIHIPSLAVGTISVRIQNLVGGLVQTLSPESIDGPEQTVRFDGRDATGAALAAGTYVYQVSLTTPMQERRRFQGFLHVVR